MIGTKTARRPRRSAIRPKNTAPTGLMINAVPYTANAAKSTVEGSSAGKNTGPMMVANAPYRAKSYHCTALPRHSGRTAVRVADASPDCCLVPVSDMTVSVVNRRYRRGDSGPVTANDVVDPDPH